MATAGNLVTTIISDLGRGDTSLSDVVLIDVQSSIREYEAKRFFFNEQTLSVTLSATDTYPLSLFATAGSVADVVEVDSVTVVIGVSRNYDLAEMPFKDLLAISANSAGVQGYPQFYSFWNRSLVINPAANAAYLASMYAHVKFTEIAAGGFSTSNVWTNEASELIRNATLKRLWGRRYRDYEAAKAAGVAELDALQSLQRRTDAMSGGSLSGYL